MKEKNCPVIITGIFKSRNWEILFSSNSYIGDDFYLVYIFNQDPSGSEETDFHTLTYNWSVKVRTLL